MEFIGDSVVNLVAALALFHRFPDSVEGDLSRLRSKLVCQEGLATVAREFDLGAAIRLGAGEEKSGGRDRDSVLADALEAIAGAIALDTDFTQAVNVVTAWFEPQLASLDLGHSKDAKTRLQEHLQGQGLRVPDYVVVRTRGKDHEQLFEVECRIEALGLVMPGAGTSRKKAEQMAAEASLTELESYRDR